MDSQLRTLIAVIILIVMVIIGYFLYQQYKKSKNKKIGRRGEKSVARKLNAICRKKGFRVIHDLYLPLYDKTTQIDHVVIGDFGIVAVETKALNGEIYGSAEDECWAQVIGTKKNRHYNPLKQNAAHIDCMRHILKKDGVYVVVIDSLVVFSSKNVYLNIEKGMPVITLNLLKKYFKKPKYNKDANVDIDKVYNTLMKYRITDKERIKAHNKNVKEMKNKF